MAFDIIYYGIFVLLLMTIARLHDAHILQCFYLNENGTLLVLES